MLKKEIPSQLVVKNSRVTFHCLGAGFGEAIVVVIGGVICVGIDCCRTLIQSGLRRGSYLENLLHEEKNLQYFFWVLTHYHTDHFLGLSAVLDLLRERLSSVIVPGEYTKKDLKSEIKKETLRDHRGNRVIMNIAEDEYLRLKKREDWFLGSRTGSSVWFDTTLRSSRQSLPFAAVITSPSPARARRIVQRSVTGLAGGGKSAVNRGLANEASYVLQLNFGSWSAVLLGDAPLALTNNIDFDKSSKLRFLKVAHHGAMDGTDEQLLDKFGEAVNRRVAVICPFKSQELPRREVLEMLDRKNFEVRVAGAPREGLGDWSAVRTDLEARFSGLVKMEIESLNRAGDEVVRESFGLFD